MFSLGKLNGTQTGVIIPVVLNSPRTLGSLHLEIDGPNGIWRSRGSQQGSFAPAIPLNERFTFRLTLRGGKWTCGILHGASIEYDVYYRPTESSPTGKLGVNTIVSPTRQDGAAEINANTVLYIYDRDLTESEITTAMQYFHEQELPVKSMNVLKKTYLRLVSMLTPQK